MKSKDAYTKKTIVKCNLPSGTTEHIALVELPTSGTTNHNIFRLNENDDVIWQISVELPPKFEHDCFVTLEAKNNKLFATRFHGDEFEIDQNTGIGTHIGWNK